MSRMLQKRLPKLFMKPGVRCLKVTSVQKTASSADLSYVFRDYEVNAEHCIRLPTSRFMKTDQWIVCVRSSEHAQKAIAEVQQAQIGYRKISVELAEEDDLSAQVRNYPQVDFDAISRLVVVENLPRMPIEYRTGRLRSFFEGFELESTSYDPRTNMATVLFGKEENARQVCVESNGMYLNRIPLRLRLW